jgi:predicted RNA-binding Zn-ribbon protein involved in translation (DUF1610 family)
MSINTTIMNCYSCGCQMQPEDVVAFEPDFEDEEAKAELISASYAFHCPMCGSYTEHHGGVEHETND